MKMKRLYKRNSKGFTMAELLAVIAITLILSMVGIIAVTYYMRIMKHLEYDAMAKEIYVAAQNHLSLAYNEGYLGLSGDDKFGTKEGKIGSIDDTDANSNIYYFVVSEADSTADDIFDLLLPFGSIEEKVRSKSSYIIRYDKSAGRILDVFYSELDGYRYGHTFLNAVADNAAEYNKLLTIRPDEKKNQRRYFDIYSDRADNSYPIVGYYGGDKAKTLPYGDLIEVPYIRVINNEELKVEVKIDDTKYDATVQFRLLLKGEASDAMAYLPLAKSAFSGNTITSLLDSITQSGKHFDDVMRTMTYKDNNSNKLFYPGENLTVWVEAFDNTKLTNVAKSIEITTNSLYGDLSTVDKEKTAANRVADISNIRHLENLEKKISSLDNTSVSIDRAEQSVDLDWIGFTGKFSSAVNIYSNINGDDILASNNHYYPVNLPVDYDGKNHSIGRVNINTSNMIQETVTSNNAGLFGLVDGRSIANLKLTDFLVNASGNVGSLAGYVTGGGTVTNVLACDDDRISSISGGINVGGLVGKLEDSIIDRSAAAVLVNDDANHTINYYNRQESGTVYAGGLVGYANSVSKEAKISNSYAAAHTNNGELRKSGDTTFYDVNGKIAGGLVGYAKDTSISNSYATCSVNGTDEAGGFAGHNSGYSGISNSYAVGRVNASEEDTDYKGAFIGNDTSNTAHAGSGYMAAANDGVLGAFGTKSNNSRTISRLDLNVSTYRAFISDITIAEPYDTPYLSRRYLGKYPYRGFGTSSTSGNEEIYVEKHYGDWPDYEVFAINN